MAQGEIAVIEGNSFVVSNDQGDIVAGTPHGVFTADTRFLSTYTLSVNGLTPILLSSHNSKHDAASFYSTNRTSGSMLQGQLSITRDRNVADGVRDSINIVNYCADSRSVSIEIRLDADFADIFEVRGAERVKTRTVQVKNKSGSELAFQYIRPGFHRETLVTFSQKPRIEDKRACFSFELRAQETWHLDIEITLLIEGQKQSALAEEITHPNFVPPSLLGHQTKAHERDMWIKSLPKLITNHKNLQLAFKRAVDDLDALRLLTPTGDRIPAAGLPWYLALFGRDSILTALQTMILGPDLAIGTLRCLGYYQAEGFDEFRDQQPGKIPHEIRLGELAYLDEVPHSRYYGTVDATPLYLVLLSEVFRWTGDLALVQQLLPIAERALTWIDRYGDIDGDGYVEYERQSPQGLINQGWKDSTDCISFRDGRIAAGPIALAEVQGYVYDAKLRMAELFTALGSFNRAADLHRQAAELKSRFNRDFWLPDEGYFALALDGEKRQVDSITSNPGHCLWSGIVDQKLAPAMVERLMARDLFSGWGIRTMSSRMANYNPISYHNGSVWPHDNSIIAAGLRRYGFDWPTLRIAEGLFSASERFPLNRLPELFAGYERRHRGYPVEYPGANAPQAWAAGAVVSLVQSILGIETNGSRLIVNPAPDVNDIELRGMIYQGTRIETVSTANARSETRIQAGVSR